MKTIAVTFAGRKIFMEILFPYIKKYEKYIDEYHIYAATNNEEDLNYINNFAKENNFVKIFNVGEGKEPTSLWNECYVNSQDPNSIYIKIDDDIVFIDDSLFTDFVEFRKNNPQYPIVYPLIVNNTYTSWVIQDKMGIQFSEKSNFDSRWNSVSHLIKDYIKSNGIPERLSQIIPEEFILCPIGWGNVNFAKSVHDKFLTCVSNNTIEDFKKSKDLSPGLILDNNPPVSINACSWLGSGMKEYTKKFGDVWQDESWLSVYLPILEGYPNYIYYNCIVSHYSYYRQMENGIMESDILDRYNKIKPNI